MLGKKFKSSLRKILIGMLLQRVNVRLYTLDVGNQKKMLKKKFLVCSLNLRRGILQRRNLIRRLPMRKMLLDFV